MNGGNRTQNSETWSIPAAAIFVAVNEGYSQAASPSKIYMHRYDQTGGTLVWQKEFRQSAGFFFYANDICAAPDGGYLVAGAENVPGLLIKTDAKWQSGLALKFIRQALRRIQSIFFLGLFQITPTTTAQATGL